VISEEVLYGAKKERNILHTTYNNNNNKKKKKKKKKKDWSHLA